MIKRMKELTEKLNACRNSYYNLDAPPISDREYDRLFDELAALEKRTGITFSNSPTQTVGCYPVSRLGKVMHQIPLRSLDKTKQTAGVLSFIGKKDVLVMLKLDGLTTKLVYEDGSLVQASTRGNGEVGEDVTHNMPAFANVPLSLPYKGRLVICGESFIPTDIFKRMKDKLRDGDGKPYVNSRNLASGSLRSLDPGKCMGRGLHFMAFSVMESGNL